ncbi:hypothetical protein AM593_01544, partial [Mytilus galloprovincialis]
MKVDYVAFKHMTNFADVKLPVMTFNDSYAHIYQCVTIETATRLMAMKMNVYIRLVPGDQTVPDVFLVFVRTSMQTLVIALQVLIVYQATVQRVITQAIDILHAQVKFMDAENTTVSSPEDVNSPRNVPKKWTNNLHLKTMEFSLGAIYKALGDIPKFGEYTETIKGEDKTLSHFVTEFKYGIIAGEMKAILIRDKITAVSLFNENCKDNAKRSSPFSVNEMFSCEKTLKFADQFRHNDELTISVEIENGGYYVYENRDDRLGYKITKKWPTYSVNLKGIKTVESYTFHWDTELPYYYCIKWFCAYLPLYVPDTSKSVSIMLSLLSNS